MYKITNGVRVSLNPSEVKQYEALKAQEELRKYEEERITAVMEKVFSLKDDGLSEKSIKIILPEAVEVFQSKEYVERKRHKEQIKLELIEAQKAEEEEKQAKKIAELQAKIKLLKRSGYDEDAIKIILPETEALFKVSEESTKRVGKVSK